MTFNDRDRPKPEHRCTRFTMHDIDGRCVSHYLCEGPHPKGSPCVYEFRELEPVKRLFAEQGILVMERGF